MSHKKISNWAKYMHSLKALHCRVHANSARSVQRRRADIARKTAHVIIQNRLEAHGVQPAHQWNVCCRQATKMAFGMLGLFPSTGLHWVQLVRFQISSFKTLIGRIPDWICYLCKWASSSRTTCPNRLRLKQPKVNLCAAVRKMVRVCCHRKCCISLVFPSKSTHKIISTAIFIKVASILCDHRFRRTPSANWAMASRWIVWFWVIF